jgi:hypothetical protein
MNESAQEMERKLLFHERKMNDPGYPKYWRERCRVMYWHYLELLTKPEGK